jgi:uncharacterized protein
MTDNFKRPYMHTHTGAKFYFDNPEGNDYRPEDMAHSAALLCRFNGHTREHYSVGQHELYASFLVEPRLAFADP